jgi:hypothetical protein
MLVLVLEGFQAGLAEVGGTKKTLDVGYGMKVPRFIWVVIIFYQIQVQPLFLLSTLFIWCDSYELVSELRTDNQDLYAQKLFK